MGVLYHAVPALVGVIAIPVGVLGYLAGNRVQPWRWQLIFAALLSISWLFAMAVSGVIGLIEQKTTTQQSAMVGIHVTWFVGILLLTTLFTVGGAIIDRLRG